MNFAVAFIEIAEFLIYRNFIKKVIENTCLYAVK